MKRTAPSRLLDWAAGSVNRRHKNFPSFLILNRKKLGIFFFISLIISIFKVNKYHMITLQEASLRTGIPSKTLRTWAKDGVIKTETEKFSGAFRYLISEEDANSLIRKPQVKHELTHDKQVLAEAFKRGEIDYQTLIKALEYREVAKDPFDENWLIIGDIHEPFSDPAYFEFCKKQKKRFNATRFIFTGDEYDGHHISFHESDPDGVGAGKELRMAIEGLKKWHDEFQNAIVLTGNHSSLNFRKAFSAGLPKAFLKPIKEVLEVPTWEYYVEYANSRFRGGHGDDGKNIQKKVLFGGLPYLQGHHHSDSKLEFYSETLWGMQVACGIDKDSYAFGYAGKGAKRMLHTLGGIVEGDPLVIAKR